MKLSGAHGTSTGRTRLRTHKPCDVFVHASQALMHTHRTRSPVRLLACTQTYVRAWTGGQVLELHNVHALNLALGVQADWGDYTDYFCMNMYGAPMPVDSVANQRRGVQVWIQQLRYEMNEQQYKYR